MTVIFVSRHWSKGHRSTEGDIKGTKHEMLKHRAGGE